MAEVTGLRNNALPYPVYGVPYGVVFPCFDADGDLITGAAGLDSEKSLNGDTFADCTNEATEIATSSGMYYLLLTAAEMTADVVAIIVKTSTSGAKTTPIVLYPRKLPTSTSGTAQGGTSSTLILGLSAVQIAQYYRGMILVTTGGTGAGQARIIDDYYSDVGGWTAGVVPDWATAPDSDTTYDVLGTDTQVPLTAIADAVWDEIDEGSITMRNFMRIMLAALAGKTTGGGTTTVAFRDQADTKDRIAATVDASGNRSSVTIDGG